MKLNPIKVTQFVLRKQHLLEGFKATDVVQAVQDAVGLHAASITTPYLSLFARVKNFERKHLDQELYQHKSLGRVECMRSTLFIVPKETIPVMYRVYKGGLATGILETRGISSEEYGELSHLILEVLKGKALAVSQIKKLLPVEIQRTLSRRVGKNIVRVTNVALVLYLMLMQGILISIKRPGAWKIVGPSYYARFVDWFPDVNINEVSPYGARIQLVRLYLQSYGPATDKDISWWTGFKKNEVRRLLESLKDEVVDVEISGLESSFMMLRSDFRKLKHFKRIKKLSVSLLPYEDSYVKGYWERERLVPKEFHDSIYPHGEASPTILVDGRIVGTWRLEEEKNRTTLILHFLREIEESVLHSVRLEAKAVSRFIYGREVQLMEQ